MDGVLVDVGSVWPYGFQIAASGQTIWEDAKVVPMILLYIITESCGFPHSQHFCAQNEKRIRGQLMKSTTYNLPHVHLASVLQVCEASGNR
jgi:hypothetical protein